MGARRSSAGAVGCRQRPLPWWWGALVTMGHCQNLCVTLWQQWYLVGRASSHKLCKGRRCWSAPPPCHNGGFPKQLFKKTILIQQTIGKGFGIFPFPRVQISPVLCSSWLSSPRNAAPGPAAPGNECLVPMQERPKRPCTFYISVGVFFCFLLFCFIIFF